MISKNTWNLVINQSKPLKDAGIIPEDEFVEMCLLSRPKKKENKKQEPEKPQGGSRFETAKMLGCSLRSVDRLIAEGRLAARRIGKRKVTILLSDVQDFLDTNVINQEK